MRHIRLTIVAVGKKNIMYSKYVFVALIIQYAKRMRSIALSFLACLSVT